MLTDYNKDMEVLIAAQVSFTWSHLKIQASLTGRDVPLCHIPKLVYHSDKPAIIFLPLLSERQTDTSYHSSQASGAEQHTDRPSALCCNTNA